MDKVLHFIKSNYIALGVAAVFYVIYLQFTIAGNRICDCENTEKYQAGNSRSGIYRGGVSRFYHK